MMMIRNALPLAFILVAACARSEEATFSSIGNESGTAVEAVRTSEGEDEEIALGEWRAGLQEEQATLEFGPGGAPPLFSLRCDARRGTLLQRHGAAPSGDLPVMLVTVGSETRRFALSSAGGAIPMLRATLPATDQFRAVLTGSAATPIIVRIGDAPPLVLPPSPMIGSYATGCANGENQRRVEVEAAANETAAEAQDNQAAPAGQ